MLFRVEPPRASARAEASHGRSSEARTTVGRNEYIKWPSEVGTPKFGKFCTYTKVSDEVITPKIGRAKKRRFWFSSTVGASDVVLTPKIGK